jgi:hypothetical protein
MKLLYSLRYLIPSSSVTRHSTSTRTSYLLLYHFLCINPLYHFCTTPSHSNQLLYLQQGKEACPRPTVPRSQPAIDTGVIDRAYLGLTPSHRS